MSPPLLISIGPALGIAGRVWDVVVGDAVSWSFAVYGAVGAVRLRIESSTLGEAFEFTDNGDGTCEITSAAADAIDDFEFTLRAIDANRQPVRRRFRFAVRPQPLRIVEAFVAAQEWLAYTDAVAILGGVAPYTITAASGVPDGFAPAIDVDELRLDGTPDTDTAGEHSLSVSIADAAGAVFEFEQVLEIAAHGPLWTPAYLNDAAWFEFDHNTTLTDNAIDVTWFDRTGTAIRSVDNDGSASRAPVVNAAGLNGCRTLTYDGSNDYSTSSASGGSDARTQFQQQPQGWVFAVARRTTETGANHAIHSSYVSASGATRTNLRFGDSTEPNRISWGGRRLDAESFAAIYDPAEIAMDWQIVLAASDWSTGQAFIYRNGVLSHSGTIFSAGNTSNTSSLYGFTLASQLGSTHGAVEIAAVLSGRTIPSLDEIQRLSGYYAHEFGLTSQLAVDHPYKLYPPTVPS